MAVVKKNIIIDGTSGKLGKNIVIRQVKGRTILATTPVAQEKIPSEKQMEQRKRFKLANHYADLQMQNPSTRELYETKAANMNISARNLAIKDYFHAPEILEIDAKKYNGHVGDRIFIDVIDDLCVEEVEIAIQHADGSLVEKGKAEKCDGTFEWQYVASVENDMYSNDTVHINALGHAGNKSEKDFVLEAE
jgi:hypothetical protein